MAFKLKFLVNGDEEVRSVATLNKAATMRDDLAAIGIAVQAFGDNGEIVQIPDRHAHRRF
jgi:hypothetical protein